MESVKNVHFWATTLAEVFQTLNSSPNGLTQVQAADTLRALGPNSIKTKAKTTPLGLLLRQFKNPIVLILIFATIVSAFLQDWPDAVIILLIVLGSAWLSFLQEYNASHAAEKLKEQVSFRSRVLRDGKAVSIPSESVVPGDIILLSAGSLIPADGLVIEARDFFVNQAALTGETFPVEKKPGVTAENATLSAQTNVVFMGTNVRSGTARALVVSTGFKTAFGQIAGKLTLRPPETGFEHGIKQLGYLLTEIMLLLVIGIFFANVFFHKPALDSLLFSIALAVGLTPQLLPAIININLSKGSQKMAQKGVIVRRLEALENFGSMDVLCTDKTGTLTKGVLQLDGALDVNGDPSNPVALYAYLNAKLQTGLANPLDEAIINQTLAGAEAYEKIDELPYDFVRKRLSIMVRHNSSQTLITKGALEHILAVCKYIQLDGQKKILDTEAQAQINQKLVAWSAQGYRVLGVAFKNHEESNIIAHTDECEMTFVGFLLFFDPPKPDAQATIEALDRLGVRLKIITGDNHLVAGHTGQAVGLKNTRILTGSELEHLSDEALWHAVEETSIFAEVDPNEKERIIMALKKRRHVVGYMGDGINDAPSLHSADVGISVENAVDVAKEAADILLLQHDLGVLCEGIVQGRKTFANTLKYIFMAVSANFGNMFSMAGASLFLPFLPMLPKQIMLINFLTDLPEMTIAGDRVDDAYTKQPRRMDIAFIRRFMLVFGPLSSIFDFATFAALTWVIRVHEHSFQTAWFVESVMSASLIVFVLRTRKPIFHSKPSRWMLAITALIILVAVYLPYSPLAPLLGFVPLTLPLMLVIFSIVVVYFFSAELIKHWFYRWADKVG